MAPQLGIPPADCSTGSSNETQNSAIDGAGDAASRLFGTTAPPQLPGPTLTETFSYDNLPRTIRPRLAQNEHIDVTYNGSGVPPRQENAPLVPPSIAHGFEEHFFNGLLQLLYNATGRDGVALIYRIAHQLDLLHLVHPPPPVPGVPAQPFPNSSTTYPVAALPELYRVGIGHSAEIPCLVGVSSAQTNNPYPVRIAAEQPRRFPGHAPPPASRVLPQPFQNSSTTQPAPTLPSSAQMNNPYPHHIAIEQPERFPGSSTTHPMTTRWEFGGNWSLLENSTASFHGIPPANVSPTSPAIPQCEPWHELVSVVTQHGTNPSPGAANPVSMALRKARNRPVKELKPGLCSMCGDTGSAQWRTHPNTGEQLCNKCGQRERGKTRKQQEWNAHAG
ncbi:hypothetical protein B0H11DRAFT_1122013 [Mycena galericulata]|nr:hypothetical protein B0H11DRAFT_1122013 [Mycena galericulata]